MLARLAAFLLLAAGLRGCVAYEYDHEFWLKVDGSGSVYVTGRPELLAMSTASLSSSSVNVGSVSPFGPQR